MTFLKCIFFAKCEVNNGRLHQLTTYCSWNGAEETHKAGKSYVLYEIRIVMKPALEENTFSKYTYILRRDVSSRYSDNKEVILMMEWREF